MARHAGGNWSIGNAYGAIVTDEPYEGGIRGYDHPEHMKAYGGYLVAESVAECNRPLLSAAKDMYEALSSMLCPACNYPIGYEKGVEYACGYCLDARVALAKARGEVS